MNLASLSICAETKGCLKTAEPLNTPLQARRTLKLIALHAEQLHTTHAEQGGLGILHVHQHLVLQACSVKQHKGLHHMASLVASGPSIG